MKAEFNLLTDMQLATYRLTPAAVKKHLSHYSLDCYLGNLQTLGLLVFQEDVYRATPKGQNIVSQILFERLKMAGVTS